MPKIKFKDGDLIEPIVDYLTDECSFKQKESWECYALVTYYLAANKQTRQKLWTAFSNIINKKPNEI